MNKNQFCQRKMFELQDGFGIIFVLTKVSSQFYPYFDLRFCQLTSKGGRTSTSDEAK